MGIPKKTAWLRIRSGSVAGSPAVTGLQNDPAQQWLSRACPDVTHLVLCADLGHQTPGRPSAHVSLLAAWLTLVWTSVGRRQPQGLGSPGIGLL